jgi:phospholipid/cholesterol/gamma-HCH transport system substrate-binding protein
MASTGAQRTHVRLAAALLASLMLAFAVLTYLSYTSFFSSIDTVTITAPRAGLEMDRGNKVKYRGLQIGKVDNISYSHDEAPPGCQDPPCAKLTLAIDSGELRFIPSNAQVHIASNTIFGAKSVEFITPQSPSPTSLRPGAHIRASDVSLEVNTLFQSLIDLLQKIDPVELNGTLSALAEGLRGHGNDFGSLLSGLNTLTQQVNPKLPTLQQDFRKTAAVANIYADAAPDLNTTINNLPTISKTVVDEKDDLNYTLLAATGLSNNAYDTLAPAQQDFIDAIKRLRAPLKVAGDYSPEFGCMFAGIVRGIKEFAPALGVKKAGLFTSSSFILGAPSYTYPESLPIVNASGGPNCRGLPDIPTKQNGGSWYRAPFLVTDNAYIPYEPPTELQVDAPSTLQFLFHGAYAERDDF